MLRLVIWPNMMLLGWTETKLWTLKYGSKSIQTSLILRQRPPKSYKLLKYFMISVILFKMSKHSDFHLIFFQIEGAWQDFTVVTKLIKNFKSLYGFGGRFLKIRDVWMDFEPYFKVHSLVNDQSLHDLSCGDVSLTICYNLKLAQAPCWISERPICTFRPTTIDSNGVTLFLRDHHSVSRH